MQEVSEFLLDVLDYSWGFACYNGGMDIVFLVVSIIVISVVGTLAHFAEENFGVVVDAVGVADFGDGFVEGPAR